MEQAQLGKYVIESEIGRGAMGVVYKAKDTVLERTVAVKTVNMALEKDHADKYEARFYQEARAAGGLNHPNIVTVYDAGKAGDVVYMAMEYIQGVELRTLLTEGQPMALGRALAIAAQVAEGLGYAHQAGVVHRDIKPANIMVTADGPVKTQIFSRNTARLYRLDMKAAQGALTSDKIAAIKAEYVALGGERSNARYGYVHRVTG